MGKTILVADDSPTIQKVVELTFVDTDYQVVTVSGGNELLEKLPQVSPDIVLCDVLMPDMDGYEVCQRIKSNPETLHIPVVLLTGTFEPFDRERALAAGCDEIVTKPFEAKQLVATVEKLLTPQAEPEAAFATEEDSELATVLVKPPEEEEEQKAPEEEPQQQEPEALDFTTSGFAEMEARASQPEPIPPPPEEGLDFTTSGFAEMEAKAKEEAEPEPTVEPSLPEEEPVEETAPLEIPIPERQPEPMSEEPFLAPMEPEPASAQSMEEEEPAFFPEEPETGGEEIPPAAPPEQPEYTPEQELPSPPPAMESQAPETEQPPTPQPQPIQPEPQITPPPSEPVEEPQKLELNDKMVERIARRVVELYSEKLEQIAWEIIPEVAELVVSRRIRELEEEAEQGSSS